MDTLAVAVISSRSRFCDKNANLEHFTALTRCAVGKGARLVLFPELALTSYTTERDVLDVAESIPGPITEALAKLAMQHRVYISIGMPEKAREKYYITQIMVGPEGYMGKYRKHHPTKAERKCGFSPGKTFPFFSIDGFRTGVNICADGRKQDTIEAMRHLHVEVVLHPHGNGLSLGRNAEEWTRGKTVYFVPRAIYSRAYILINNSAGDTVCPAGPTKFGSGALVIDPLGQVVKRTTQRTRSEKMILATLVKPLSEIIPDFEIKRL